MQKVICASVRVTILRRTFMERKSSIRPMAVTISGLSTGRLLTSRMIVRMSFRALEMPMAAIVPITVEHTVAMTAMITVYLRLSSMSGLLTISSYHRREKPENLIMLFESLKEKSIT